MTENSSLYSENNDRKSLHSGNLPFFLMSISPCCRSLMIHTGLILVTVFAIIVMGCVLPSQVTSSQPTRATTVPAVQSVVPETPASSGPPVTVSSLEFVTANLPYGVTISYPQNWERKDVGTPDVRDYGRSTVNIANFFSPYAIQGDAESYTSMGIDIDQSVDTDLEQYFNLATIALGKYYGSSWEITKHSFQLTISDYKSYELDWQTKDERGVYVFTKAKGDVYIIAVKSPNSPRASGAYSDEIEQMYKSVRLDPSDGLVTKHR